MSADNGRLEGGDIDDAPDDSEANAPVPNEQPGPAQTIDDQTARQISDADDLPA